MQNIIIIKTTLNNPNIRKNIVNELIKKRLATCINCISNNISTFLWKNKIVEEKEDIILIKTILANESVVYDIIKKYHDYDIPEILTIKIDKTDIRYLKWSNDTILGN